MKKILILLSAALLSCDSGSHSPETKIIYVKIYFPGTHQRNMYFDLPTDAILYLRPDPQSLCWRSDNPWCGSHVLKYNVIDFEVINSK